MYLARVHACSHGVRAWWLGMRYTCSHVEVKAGVATLHFTEVNSENPELVGPLVQLPGFLGVCLQSAVAAAELREPRCPLECGGSALPAQLGSCSR